MSVTTTIEQAPASVLRRPIPTDLSPNTSDGEGRAATLATFKDHQDHVLPHKKLMVVFPAIALAQMISYLDQTSVSTALPAIGDGLNMGPSISWVATSFLVASTSVQLINGRLSDIVGRKPLLITCMGILAIGNLGAGFSTTPAMLFAFRALSGLGGGMITALVMIVCSDITTLEQRGKYNGFIGAMVALGNGLGPIIGGAVTQRASWRWVFWFIVPLIVTVMVLLYLAIPPSQVRGKASDKIKMIDWVGLLINIAAVLLLLIPISEGGALYAWDSSFVIGMLSVGGLLAIAFVIHEWKFAKLPMMPIRLFQSDYSANLIFIQATLHGLVYWANLFYVPLYLQNVRGYDPVVSGALIIPMVASHGIGSIISGQIISRTGHYNPCMITANFVWLVGISLQTMYSRTTPIWAVCLIGFLQGIGIGCAFQPSLVALLAHSRKADRAVVNSLRNFLRTIGGSVGLTICGTILNNILKSHLSPYIAPSDINQLTSSVYALLSLNLTPEQHDRVLDAYMSGMHAIFVLYAPIIGICCIAAVLIKDNGVAEKDAKKDEQRPVENIALASQGVISRRVAETKRVLKSKMAKKPEECEAQVLKYSGAAFKGFESRATTQKEWEEWERKERSAEGVVRGTVDIETNIQENVRGPADTVVQPVFETNSIAYPGKNGVHSSLSLVPGKGKLKRTQEVMDLTGSGGDHIEKDEPMPVKRLKSDAYNLRRGTSFVDLTSSDEEDEDSSKQLSSDVEDAIEEQEDLDQDKTLDPEVVGDKPIILTASQQAVVKMALKGHNIFLTGAAGSGKTATLRAILQRFEARYAAPSKRRRKTTDKDAEDGIKYPPVQVIAPTGIAALPLGGKTTYSFAGWNQDSFLHPLADLLKNIKQSVYKAIEALKVLVIEEISMVENQFLERLNALMKQVLKSPRPFGGKQVIFLGDFHQLPPVKPFQFCLNCGEEMIKQQVAPTCNSGSCQLFGRAFAPGDKWAFKAPVWTELKLRHIKLEQIHRQPDARFQNVLNKIRNGIRLTVQEWQALTTRKTLPNGAFAIRLMSRLVKVRAFNEAQLNSINSKPESWNALDSSQKLFYTEEDKYRMNEISRKLKEHKNSLQEHRWPTNLTLKVGAKVVLLHNLSHERGLVNGSQGTVVGFANTSNWPVADAKGNKAERDAELIKAFQAANSFICPIVRFTNGRTETIMPISSESLRGPSADRYRVCRTQIPLGLAWALSIHKSQGMTLEYVEVSSQDIFESGQLYVGLSRAQRMEGLTVTGYRLEQMGMDQDVLDFYQNTKWESLGPSNVGLDIRTK